MIGPALLTSMLLGAPPAPQAGPQALVPDSVDGERYGRLAAPDLTLRFAPRDSLVAEEVLESGK